LLNKGENVVIEGTQGFGLSPINSTFYPYCTSRDTTAAGFLMETGLSPFDVENVIMVIRAFPIRVGGNSGPLQNELGWDEISKTSGANIDLTEYTSCTQRIRRVGGFDAEIVKKAIEVNNPNIIVMNHLDYLDYCCNNCSVLSDKIINYIQNVESSINSKIDYAGTGKNKLVNVKGLNI
jgi:adenylosuccinate synthase